MTGTIADRCNRICGTTDCKGACTAPTLNTYTGGHSLENSIRVWARGNWCIGTLEAVRHGATYGARVRFQQRNGKAVCRWMPAGRVLMGKALADRLTREHTAFATMKEMLTAAGGYRPTLRRCVCAEVDLLAHTYNRRQEMRQDSRRSFPERTDWRQVRL